MWQWPSPKFRIHDSHEKYNPQSRSFPEGINDYFANSVSNSRNTTEGKRL
jgi:hypothetical protein